MKDTFFAHGEKLVAVEPVGCFVRVAKEEPVLPGGLRRLALLQEGSERGDAGAWAYHDDRCAQVLGEFEVFRRLEEHRNGSVAVDPVGQVGGANPLARTAAVLVGHLGHGEVNLVGVCFWAGRDGVETWIEFAKLADERFSRNKVGGHLENEVDELVGKMLAQ